MDIEKLKKSLQGETYTDLVTFLTINLRELKDLDSVQEYSKAQDQAIELKAQKKAYKKLENILSKVITIHDLPSSEEQSAAGNDYGLDEK